METTSMEKYQTKYRNRGYTADRQMREKWIKKSFKKFYNYCE